MTIALSVLLILVSGVAVLAARLLSKQGETISRISDENETLTLQLKELKSMYSEVRGRLEWEQNRRKEMGRVNKELNERCMSLKYKSNKTKFPSKK